MKNTIKNRIKELRNKKGFTLIELIVVIAVLGILVLLAAPKFLGYTKDANVTAMEADAKTLSNASIVHFVDSEKDGESIWPIEAGGAAETVTVGTETIEGYAFDEDLIGPKLNSLKGELDDYILVIDGDREGEVIHKTGVEDRDGDTHFGIDLEVVAP